MWEGGDLGAKTAHGVAFVAGTAYADPMDRRIIPAPRRLREWRLVATSRTAWPRVSQRGAVALTVVLVAAALGGCRAGCGADGTGAHGDALGSPEGTAPEGTASEGMAPEGMGSAPDEAVLRDARQTVTSALRDLDGTPEADARAAAIATLDALCAELPMVGCAPLGELHRVGTGVEQDRQEAERLFRQACDAGDGAGCLGIGRMYRLGQGVERDDSAAHAAYARGCALGSAAACNGAGVLSRDGDGVAADLSAAFGHFRSACALGFWDACAGAAELAAEVGASPAEVETVWRGVAEGCEEADVRCCIAHGRRSLDAGDAAAARTAFRDACNAGDLAACVEVARLMNAGRGGDADPALARQLLDAACRGAEPSGCVDLAEVYTTGDGVEADAARAALYRRAACDLGVAAACE